MSPSPIFNDSSLEPLAFSLYSQFIGSRFWTCPWYWNSHESEWLILSKYQTKLSCVPTISMILFQLSYETSQWRGYISCHQRYLRKHFKNRNVETPAIGMLLKIPVLRGWRDQFLFEESSKVSKGTVLCWSLKSVLHLHVLLTNFSALSSIWKSIFFSAYIIHPYIICKYWALGDEIPIGWLTLYCSACSKSALLFPMQVLVLVPCLCLP